MKLSSLPEDTNVQTFKLKLPEDALAKFKAFAGGEPEMYVVGPVMGWGCMMSPEPPDHKGKRRLFPVPEDIHPKEILEWEVVS